MFTGIVALASGLFIDDRYKTAAWIIVGICAWGVIWVPVSSKAIGWSRSKSRTIRILVPAISFLTFFLVLITISSTTVY
ncbi:hypothetical protein PLANTIT3_80108 [Plantibacter sp. T3]|nr:hypothetical protein PLANTIT3_80108 [Plantibacter sp. T3]